MTTMARYRSSIAVVVFNPDNVGDVITKKASAVVYTERRRRENIVSIKVERYVRIGSKRVLVHLDNTGRPFIRLTREHFLSLFPS
jgi:hypothetical protein